MLPVFVFILENYCSLRVTVPQVKSLSTLPALTLQIPFIFTTHVKNHEGLCVYIVHFKLKDLLKSRKYIFRSRHSGMGGWGLQGFQNHLDSRTL